MCLHCALNITPEITARTLHSYTLSKIKLWKLKKSAHYQTWAVLLPSRQRSNVRWTIVTPQPHVSNSGNVDRLLAEWHPCTLALSCWTLTHSLLNGARSYWDRLTSRGLYIWNYEVQMITGNELSTTLMRTTIMSLNVEVSHTAPFPFFSFPRNKKYW